MGYFFPAISTTMRLVAGAWMEKWARFSRSRLGDMQPSRFVSEGMVPALSFLISEPSVNCHQLRFMSLTPFFFA